MAFITPGLALFCRRSNFFSDVDLQLMGSLPLTAAASFRIVSTCLSFFVPIGFTGI